MNKYFKKLQIAQCVKNWNVYKKVFTDMLMIQIYNIINKDGIKNPYLHEYKVQYINKVKK